jgi:hypothetical protein
MAFTKKQTIIGIGVIVLALVGIYLYKNKKTDEELSGGKDESSSGGGGGGVGASDLLEPDVVVAPPSDLLEPDVVVAPPIVVPSFVRVVRGRTMPVLNFNPSITPPITPTLTQQQQNINTVGGRKAGAIIPANGGDYYSATKDGYYF